MLLDGFNHVAVLTGSTERFVRFYSEVFGAETVGTQDAPMGRLTSSGSGRTRSSTCSSSRATRKRRSRRRCSAAAASTTSACRRHRSRISMRFGSACATGVQRTTSSPTSGRCCLCSSVIPTGWSARYVWPTRMRCPASQSAGHSRGALPGRCMIHTRRPLPRPLTIGGAATDSIRTLARMRRVPVDLGDALKRRPYSTEHTYARSSTSTDREPRQDAPPGATLAELSTSRTKQLDRWLRRPRDRGLPTRGMRAARRRDQGAVMSGSISKRCPCPVRYTSRAVKRLACRKDHGPWTFVVGLRDPASGKRRQVRQIGISHP